MASSTQPYSPDTCMICYLPLSINAEDEFPDDEDDFEPPEAEPGPSTTSTTILDDVELYCGPPGSGPSNHHTHWACLIGYAMDKSISGEAPVCPICSQNVINAEGRFVVDVRNEGGETRGFDFGDILEEELFLETHPDQFHARAFHKFIESGEFDAAQQLLEQHDLDVNCTFGSDGRTALQKAQDRGNKKGEEFLKRHGA